MLRVFLFFIIISSKTVTAQQPPAQLTLVPWPVEVKQAPGTLYLQPYITVSSNFPEKDWQALYGYLHEELFKIGFVPSKAEKGERGDIDFSMTRMPTSGKPAYILKVDTSGIRISANFHEPAFHAIQTLLQLIPIRQPDRNGLLGLWNMPLVEIFDHARFNYRGMHLDVCRHFFPVSFVKRYIDYLAYHKMNKFHWHLTEDQGWRIEIKKYPSLTTVGSWRNGTIIGRYPGTGSDNTRYGGHYTQEEIKEVVKYAKERFIEVIPEIEMPGHSSAAIAAYPWLSCFPQKPTAIPENMISAKSVQELKRGRIKLVQETWGVFDDVMCAGNDSTFMFLENVLDEVINLFPSKYVHVGGDECPKAHWKICPKCQQRMKQLGLNNEHELQSYFIQRVEKYLNSKGKVLIGWNEILEGGLAPNAVVMSWQGEKGGIEAAKQGHDVIMTPENPVYLNHSQSEREDSITFGGYNPLEKVYAYEPVPSVLDEQQAKHVLGTQGNVWTEYIRNTKNLEYMIFPRMSALSEVLWSTKENRDWKRFEKIVPALFKRYEMWEANYSSEFLEPKATVLPTENGEGVYWKIETRFAGDSILFHNYGSQKADCLIKEYGKIPDKNTLIGYYAAPYTKRILCSDTYGYTTVGTTLRLQSFSLNKATSKKIVLKEPASNSYPGDGAFTLVNGIQNEKGFARSKEFLGWSGKDCEATIDLSSIQSIDTVIVHSLDRRTSWIYRPKSVEVLVSDDGVNFKSIKYSEEFDLTDKTTYNGNTTLVFPAINARYVKVLVKNWGTIPAGMPGEGKGAWLFLDEIEVK